jgi:hypothetical protein
VIVFGSDMSVFLSLYGCWLSTADQDGVIA